MTRSRQRRRLTDPDWVVNLVLLILVGCTALVVAVASLLALHAWDWTSRSASLISLLVLSAASLTTVAHRRHRGGPDDDQP